MTAFTSPNFTRASSAHSVRHDSSLTALLKGDILLTTEPHTAWGAAVTAQMYLPLERTIVWQQLTDYCRWAEYLPALTHSQVLPSKSSPTTAVQTETRKRLYQVASKNFLFFTAQVDIYLSVLETAHQRILFQLESGSFHDFSADLKLQDYLDGTVLTYAVRATPTIPVPSLFIQQAIQLDLPDNMRHMRQVLCCAR